jgi:hypothetical protein
VARRLLVRLLNRLARRASLLLRLLRAGVALAAGCVASAMAAAPEGHCRAASAAGGCAAGPVVLEEGGFLPGQHVFFDAPTSRYAHGVLGDAIEWGALVYLERGRDGTETRQEIVLPPSRVFEDLTPRLHDLDRDGRFEIIVVESDQRLGAQLAIYGLQAKRLVKRAATPFIGTPNRWLAPLGAADLDGDGAIEIAYIDRPHLAKTLRVWRFAGDQLTELAALQGLTNHRIGEAFISGGIRDCGSGPEVITADATWRQIVATRLVDGALKARAVAVFAGPASFDPVLACAN